MTEHQHNWAGNYTYNAARLHHPETVEQVQELVAHSSKLRALGSRHSFNSVADTQGDLVALTHLQRVIKLDRAARTVTVEAGIRYGQLGEYLHREGFALHNLASLPHISVAGACATATHGSGDGNGNLATSVAAMELVTANGEVITLSRDQHGEQFHGAVVGLGGLGIVTKLTLDVVPTFMVRQEVYEHVPLAVLEEHFDDIVTHAYSVSMFTDWQGDHINQVWLKHQAADETIVPPAPSFFGAIPAPADRHPIAGVSAENCTPQMGIPGPWHERLPHFRMNFTPSSGEELQTEYFVPRQHALAALHAITELREQLAPLLMISEIRTIAADNLWMSPCYQQACVGFHFTWKQDWDRVKRLLPTIEAQLEPFGAKPHWGKLFTTPPSRLHALFTKLPDFQRLLQSYDPLGKFRNAFLDTYIFGA